jgi:hypothetical protein
VFRRRRIPKSACYPAVLSSITLLEVRCGNCGLSAPQPHSGAVGQPRQDLPPDLDTRPNGPLRDTISCWMQHCPHCGYCAGDISSVHEIAAPLIATQDYQRWLTDSRVPEPARKFLAHAHLLAGVGQIADAGWTCLHAGWLCDDLAGEAEAARFARGLALEYWRQAHRSGDEFCEPGLEAPLITDLLRRMNRMEDALLQCTQALDGLESDDGDGPGAIPALAEHLLRFEKTLIQRRDTSTYRLSDLPAFRARSI